MKQKLEVVQGDITRLEVDAIVNAANSSLMGGAGWMGLFTGPAGRLSSKRAVPSWPARAAAARAKQ